MNSNVDARKPVGSALRRHDVQLRVTGNDGKKQLRLVLSIFLSRQDSWNEKVLTQTTAKNEEL